jgi:hypothetical protein
MVDAWGEAGGHWALVSTRHNFLAIGRKAPSNHAQLI